MNAATQLDHPFVVLWAHLSDVVDDSTSFQLTDRPCVFVGGGQEFLSEIVLILGAQVFELLQNQFHFMFGISHVLNGGHGRSQARKAAPAFLASTRADTKDTCLRMSRTR